MFWQCAAPRTETNRIPLKIAFLSIEATVALFSIATCHDRIQILTGEMRPGRGIFIWSVGRRLVFSHHLSTFPHGHYRCSRQCIQLLNCYLIDFALPLRLVFGEALRSWATQHQGLVDIPWSRPIMCDGARVGMCPKFSYIHIDSIERPLRGSNKFATHRSMCPFRRW